MRIFISAAEASSDTHAGALIRALHDRWALEGGSEPLEVFGIGGPRSEAAGMEVLIPAREFLAMGFVEVLKKIPRIFRALGQIEMIIKERKPDLAILLDYPDFHFRLAARLGHQRVPVVCMIPPKIWAWRSSRLNRMRELYTHVLTILPFEKTIYEKAELPSTYIGNPLLDELPFGASQELIRRKHGIAGDRTVLILMPGSRSAELKYHLEPLLRAALLIQQQLDLREKPLFWIPLAPTGGLVEVQERMGELSWSQQLDIRLSEGDAWEAMVAANAGIIKSGTSSLEAALLRLPHIVVYRASPISEWIFKNLVRYEKPISLVNLIHDFSAPEPTVVPELILESFSPERMCKEVLSLLAVGSPIRAGMVDKFDQVHSLLASAGPGPSARAADAVMKVIRRSQEQAGAGMQDA